MPIPPKPKPRLTVTRVPLNEQQREENNRAMFVAMLREALDG